MPRRYQMRPGASENRRPPRKRPGGMESSNPFLVSSGPRPKQIGETAAMIEGRIYPVRVFEPRPAYDLDLGVMSNARTMRPNRWGSRPGEMDSL